MSRETPVVSVLVPTFNCARYLPELIRSVQAQTFDDFELIVWDDGSADNTQEILRPFRADTRLKVVLNTTNQGLGRSWASLLDMARGDFWCTPGADDALAPDFLARRLERFRQDPTLDVVAGMPEHMDTTGKPVPSPTLAAVWTRLGAGDALAALLQHNFINQPSVLARMATTRRARAAWSPDWQYAPDWALWIALAAAGASFAHDPVPAHRYRIHDSSLSLSPERANVRRAEVRAVPLVSLSLAATQSPEAARLWRRWRAALYALWLRRAFVLRRSEIISPMTQRAAQAYYGHGKPVRLEKELLRHVPSVAWYSIREGMAKRQQWFPCAGLALIDHEMFRKKTSS